MPGSVPPYALDVAVFRFPALAACVGRAPLGGDREIALGLFMAARLALGLLPPISLNADLRQKRADHAKHWLTNLAMPQPARMALLRAFDATAIDAPATANALAELGRTVVGHADQAALNELTELTIVLSAPTEQLASIVAA